MRKVLIILAVVLGSLYGVFHLVVSSSFVQSRLLEEIRAALAAVGCQLDVESIEFAAFSPRLYLNRVTLKTTEKSGIPLNVPVTIDKIKVQFEPLALLSKKLVIGEAVLFNPKILLPRADRLYDQVVKQLKEQKAVELEGASLKVIVKKIGVVDALFNVISKKPDFKIRSQSLTVFVFVESEGRQSVSVQSGALEIERGPLNLGLKKLDIAFDLTKESVRVNRASISGDKLKIELKGASSLPLESKGKFGPASWNASYAVDVNLALLNKLPELDVPQFVGTVRSEGDVSYADRNYKGSGKLAYQDVAIDGYVVQQGDLNFSMLNRKVELKKLDLKYGGGSLTAPLIRVALDNPATFSGNAKANGIRLEGILENVKEHDIPVRAKFSGPVQVTGRLWDPFKIEAKFESLRMDKFLVFDEDDEDKLAEEDRIVGVDKGTLNGKLVFYDDRMEFDSLIDLLGGKAKTEGYLGFGGRHTKIKTRTEGVSLTELGNISIVDVGGVADTVSEIDVVDGNVSITGTFNLKDAEISDVVLGDVKGLAQFQNALLSFEDLILPTKLDPVTGSGFVDFKKEDTHYKFRARVRRASLDRLFSTLKKFDLGFDIPKGGEASTRVLIEGGHDDKGVSVSATGTAKSFRWYDERWTSSNFDFTYRDDFVRLNKVILLKKSGGVEITANFKDAASELNIASRGLHLDELDYIGSAPLTGIIDGQVKLTGDLDKPALSGGLQLLKTTHRGNPLPDSSLAFRSHKEGVEVFGSLIGERLRGRWSREQDNRWELLVYFEKYDLTPMLSIIMERDIPTLTRVTATGDLSLVGRGTDWEGLTGSGLVSQLVVGLKGTPMKNEKPLSIKVEKGAFEIKRFNLIGRDSQLTSSISFEPRKSIQASLDGKLDLQFLQPFIPGLDYGTGKVALGVRVSGKPPNYNLLGNIVLENGTFRLTDLKDEFRNAQVQLSLSQDKINVDRFQASVNGGKLNVFGDVRIDQFTNLEPNLNLSATRVSLQMGDFLTTKFTGDFKITGNQQPYDLTGSCRLAEAKLVKLEVEESEPSEGKPTFNLDIKCKANKNLLVNTDIIEAEFKGDFHLLGTSAQVGLLGSAEVVRGNIRFREQEFVIRSGTVRFLSETKIAPRFNISGQTYVKEVQDRVQQEYEINLQALGTPEKPRLRLTSSPALAETDIISLLVLGVTSRTQEGNYVDLGATIVGEIPLQDKIQDEIGVDIKITPQSSGAGTQATSATPSSDITAPQVQLEKGITKKTKLIYSNTLETNPVREVKVEHELGERITVNGSVVDRPRSRSDTDSIQSYGLDFRYRFEFE